MLPSGVKRNEEASPHRGPGKHAAFRMRIEDWLEPAADGAAHDGVPVRATR